MRPVVEVRDLAKRYGEVVAVAGISFEVHAGEVFGLLGPNGAGKTTTLEILEGLRRPDGGTVRVAGVDVGRDPQAVKSRIGVQLQQAGFFPRLTVGETVRLFASFHLMGLIGLAFGRQDTFTLSVSWVDEGNPQVARTLETGLRSVSVFRVFPEPRAEALQGLREGRRTLVVMVPAQGTTLEVFYDEARPQTAQAALAAFQRFVAEANLKIAGATSSSAC